MLQSWTFIYYIKNTYAIVRLPACAHVRMCLLTENVRAGADIVQWDTGRLWFINTDDCLHEAQAKNWWIINCVHV